MTIKQNIDKRNEKRSRKRRDKKQKESFAQRTKRRAKDTASLASLLVNEPRAFPAALLQQIKRVFRVIWAARGGGLYACGFILTFLWLEISTFFGEIFAADSIGSFLSEQLLEFFFRFAVQSIQNTVRALLWPIPIIEWSPLWGAGILIGMYLVFAKFVKEPLERWLFGDDAESEGDRIEK